MRPSSEQPGGEEARRAVEAVFRREHGAILATLIRRARGDFELAEEALSEALAVALRRWPEQGAPDEPAAWIQSVAQRRLVDAQRRGGRERDHLRIDEEDLQIAGTEEDDVHYDEVPDDRLRLIFTCCHPALAHQAQVALTLNTLGGLRAVEIARAFLTREATMSQRLVRAKRKIRTAGIPYRVPPPEELEARLPAVLDVLYLIFNEGYAASGGDALVRQDLCAEGLRLARLLLELLPEEPEVRGLFALMRLQDSRRLARVDLDGSLVLLEDQDRSLWDREAIEEGRAAVEAALRRGPPGPYQLQAAIAAVHADSLDSRATDWEQIVLLYDRLLEMSGSPVVRLNRAVAVAMAGDLGRGLAEVEALGASGELDDFLYLHATRADLLRRLGHAAEARAAYHRAIELADNAAERRFLSGRLRELETREP